ncbi:unnamed protein product [Heterobilharzia americana]|nr:unnamed protein product [Heterobilharzia americana]
MSFLHLPSLNYPSTDMSYNPSNKNSIKSILNDKHQNEFTSPLGFDAVVIDGDDDADRPAAESSPIAKQLSSLSASTLSPRRFEESSSQCLNKSSNSFQISFLNKNSTNQPPGQHQHQQRQTSADPVNCFICPTDETINSIQEPARILSNLFANLPKPSQFLQQSTFNLYSNNYIHHFPQYPDHWNTLMNHEI